MVKNIQAVAYNGAQTIIVFRIRLSCPVCIILRSLFTNLNVNISKEQFFLNQISPFNSFFNTCCCQPVLPNEPTVILIALGTHYFQYDFRYSATPVDYKIAQSSSIQKWAYIFQERLLIIVQLLYLPTYQRLGQKPLIVVLPPFCASVLKPGLYLSIGHFETFGQSCSFCGGQIFLFVKSFLQFANLQP